jgi:hypothetical protein
MFRMVVVALSCWAFLSTPVMAQKAFGYASTSCGAWTQERQNKSWLSVSYVAWVLGFVSGVNTAETILLKKPDLLENTDPSGLVGWIDNYCASQPLDNLLSASAKLTITLLQKAR